jgi:hypothetical protein
MLIVLAIRAMLKTQSAFHPYLNSLFRGLLYAIIGPLPACDAAKRPAFQTRSRPRLPATQRLH